jgi:hypothetical protein
MYAIPAVFYEGMSRPKFRENTRFRTRSGMTGEYCRPYAVSVSHIILFGQ